MKFVGEALAGRPLILQGNVFSRSISSCNKGAGGMADVSVGRRSLRRDLDIGSGTAITVETIAETVKSVFANAGNLLKEGSIAQPRPLFYMDISAARAQLGWEPRFGLGEGLRDFHAVAQKG